MDFDDDSSYGQPQEDDDMPAANPSNAAPGSLERQMEELKRRIEEAERAARAAPAAAVVKETPTII